MSISLSLVIFGIILMDLSSLVYVSCRTDLTSHMKPQELRSIYETSTSNNVRLGVTGLLLATPRRFIQVLEGERRVVQDLFDRICDDTRHTNTIIRQSCTVDVRAFSDWSMNVVYVEHIGKLLYGIDDTEDDFDPYDLSHETLSGLLDVCGNQERLSTTVTPKAKVVSYLD